MDFCPFDTFPCNALGSKFNKKSCNTQIPTTQNNPSAYDQSIRGFAPSFVSNKKFSLPSSSINVPFVSMEERFGEDEEEQQEQDQDF